MTALATDDPFQPQTLQWRSGAHNTARQKHNTQYVAQFYCPKQWFSINIGIRHVFRSENRPVGIVRSVDKLRVYRIKLLLYNGVTSQQEELDSIQFLV